MIEDSEKLVKFITQVEEVAKKPEKLLTVQSEQAEQFIHLTRDLYNFSKKNENFKIKSKETLEILEIENLDEEQIWQQIDLQNNSLCSSLVSTTAHLLAQISKLHFPLKEKENMQKINEQENVNEEKYEENMEYEQNKNEGSDYNETNHELPKKFKFKNIKGSIIDDNFFKLHEMEEFLEAMENNDGKNQNDDLIDYFINDEDDPSKNLMYYSDFFDQPCDENVIESKKREEPHTKLEAHIKTKKVKFSLKKKIKENQEEGKDEDNNHDDDDDDDDNNINNDFNDEYEEEEAIKDDNSDDYDYDENNYAEDDKQKQNQKSSSFEIRQERLKSRINTLEADALKEKPWQLKGEITGTNRPQNSLLQEYVEFDIAIRPAPVLTEKSTLKLEDIIIQRIKDKAWDDVVRKIKPIESDLEYKKKLVLDHEKSKLSLAQIYEKEYLKQMDDQNQTSTEKPEVESPEYQIIRNMMKKLFTKLDALSNFHFTPKQAEPEVKIISNLPAITFEEVAPIATSDATLLAPEEVKAKTKGDFKGKTERTATDKKRQRRKKKILQKIKFQKLETKAHTQLEKQKKIKQKLPPKELQKITKIRNVTQLEESEGGKYLKSSNTFFSKLQDKTTSKVERKNLGIKTMNVGKKILKS